MGGPLKFDYYYGIEAEQFSFYRVPRLLIKDGHFKGLSSDAKLLYGLMLDRMSLSMKNGWIDGQNRAYIIYSVEDAMEDLGCSKPTCIKIIRELDSGSGIGLIEKKRRGLGKPDIIYVKNFASMEGEKGEGDNGNTDVSTEVKNLYFRKERNLTSGGKETELPEVKDFDLQREKNFTSGSKKSELPEVKDFDLQRERDFTSGGKGIELQEVKKVSPNYTYINQNNMSDTELSNINPIYPSEGQEPGMDKMDGMEDMNAYIERIKANIEYEHHMRYDDWQDKALYEELFQVICEVVCVRRPTVRIAGEEYPYELVKAKFLKLDSGHLQYVIGCMRNTTRKIGNIKSYMVTALYNAPSTMNHYYQQEVQHDMYGGGWEEKGVR